MPITALPSTDLPVGVPVSLRAPQYANGHYAWSTWCKSNPQFPLDIMDGNGAHLAAYCTNRVGTHVVRCDVSRTPPPGELPNGRGDIDVTWHVNDNTILTGLATAGSGSYPYFINDLYFRLEWNGTPLGTCATGFAQERITTYFDAGMTQLYPTEQNPQWLPPTDTNPPEFHFHSPNIFDRKTTDFPDTPQGQQAFENAAEGDAFPPFIRQEMRITFPHCLHSGGRTDVVVTLTPIRLARVKKDDKIAIVNYNLPE